MLFLKHMNIYEVKCMYMYEVINFIKKNMDMYKKDNHGYNE